MSDLTITPSPAARDLLGDLSAALASEVLRQQPQACVSGERIDVAGQLDLRRLAFAVHHALTNTAAS